MRIVRNHFGLSPYQSIVQSLFLQLSIVHNWSFHFHFSIFFKSFINLLPIYMYVLSHW